MTEPITLDTAAAAERLGVSERTLRDWTLAGIVPSIKIGGVRLYSVRALEEWAYRESRHEAQHSVSQPWWPFVATVKVQHCDSIAEAEIVEREAIRAEQPAHNVTFNVERPTRIRPNTGRRRRGTGSVCQRTSDKLWMATVRIAGRPVTRYARTEREAHRLLASLLVLADNPGG